MAKQGEQRLADRPYSIPLELRQGIGPGGVKQLVALKPLVKAAREAGAMEDDEIKVLKR